MATVNFNYTDFYHVIDQFILKDFCLWENVKIFNLAVFNTVNSLKYPLNGAKRMHLNFV